jgi:hypothetical protein
VARPCRAITLQPQARSLLLHLQADQLALLAGQQTRRLWTGKLKQERVLEVLRAFSLSCWVHWARHPTGQHPGEAASRSTACPDDWHLGVLPPEIAAPIRLTCVIFIAPETETRIAGVNWDRRALPDGEGPVINTETLRKMFDEPQLRPFRALLSARAADRKGLAAEHEAKRRCWALRNVGVATRAAARPAGWHRRRLASIRASPRYYDEPVGTGRLSSPVIPTFGPCT